MHTFCTTLLVELCRTTQNSRIYVFMKKYQLNPNRTFPVTRTVLDEEMSAIILKLHQPLSLAIIRVIHSPRWKVKINYPQLLSVQQKMSGEQSLEKADQEIVHFALRV